MSSKQECNEASEDRGATHKTLGDVWIIGFVEHSGFRSIFIVQDKCNNLHLVFEDDLDNFWCWGE